MAQLVFTTRDTFVSKAIRYITEEPVSHVAIRCNNIVVHSTGKGGVEETTWDEFQERYTMVSQAEVQANKQQVRGVVEQYKNARYDYPALLWLGARYLMKKYLRINIPKVNLWQITGMFTCTEFVTKVIDGEEDSLITPYQLYKRLS